MHLLKAQPGVVADGSEAVDLAQTPGDIVVLSAADTELASLAAARGMLGETFSSVRLANLMQLSHNASVDLYCETIIAEARLVIVRLLGGKSYWPYGVEQIVETCAGTGAALVLLPGDDQPDPELAAYSTVESDACRRLWNFLLHGGAVNARSFLACAASLIGRRFDWLEPAELPRAGICWPGLNTPGLSDLRRVWARNECEARCPKADSVGIMSIRGGVGWVLPGGRAAIQLPLIGVRSVTRLLAYPWCRQTGGSQA